MDFIQKVIDYFKDNMPLSIILAAIALIGYGQYIAG